MPVVEIDKISGARASVCAWALVASAADRATAVVALRWCKCLGVIWGLRAVTAGSKNRAWAWACAVLIGASNQTDSSACSGYVVVLSTNICARADPPARSRGCRQVRPSILVQLSQPDFAAENLQSLAQPKFSQVNRQTRSKPWNKD